MLEKLQFGSLILPAFIIIGLLSCEKEISGCLNEFAVNYNSNAEIDCCCEFQVEAIIKGLEGDYKFKDECTNFSYEYESTITGMNGINNSLILSNFSFNNMDYIATYNNGRFSIDSSYYIAGCNFNYTATITKENGSLLINSYNKVVEGLCSNISDSFCTAVSQ